MGEKLTITVVAGLCELTFRTGMSTGRDDDTNPGVGFDAVATFARVKDGTAVKGEIHFGSGVIRREDATKLRDMLEIFLKNHAAGVPA